MAWTRSNPLYPVSDVAASIKWYEDVCGFKATLVHEGFHGPNYAVLYRDAVSIHLVRAVEAQHGVKPPVQAQFWVAEEFEDLFENAKRRGARLLEPIEQRPWGHRDFLLADPDGNVVWITQAKPTFDQDFWEQLWSKTLREHGDKVAHRPPNAHLMAETGKLPPGRALDAGCGHGADTLWLAAHGWQVTAVDFAAAALAHGRSMAEAAGADVAARIDWIEGDLATWEAEPGHYDLVVCLYVHVAGSVEGMVGRMANAVAPRGTLFLVGHRPIDPITGAATAAASQVQVSVEGAVAALDSNVWELVIAEERPRAVAGTGVDAVVRARRRT